MTQQDKKQFGPIIIEEEKKQEYSKHNTSLKMDQKLGNTVVKANHFGES